MIDGGEGEWAGIHPADLARAPLPADRHGELSNTIKRLAFCFGATLFPLLVGSLTPAGFLGGRGSLYFAGFLTVNGSLYSTGFLTDFGSLSLAGFLVEAGSLRLAGFLLINGSLCAHGFLKPLGSLTLLWFSHRDWLARTS